MENRNRFHSGRLVLAFPSRSKNTHFVRAIETYVTFASCQIPGFSESGKFMANPPAAKTSLPPHPPNTFGRPVFRRGAGTLRRSREARPAPPKSTARPLPRADSRHERGPNRYTAHRRAAPGLKKARQNKKKKKPAPRAGLQVRQTPDFPCVRLAGVVRNRLLRLSDALRPTQASTTGEAIDQNRLFAAAANRRCRRSQRRSHPRRPPRNPGGL